MESYLQLYALSYMCIIIEYRTDSILSVVTCDLVLTRVSAVTAAMCYYLRATEALGETYLGCQRYIRAEHVRVSMI